MKMKTSSQGGGGVERVLYVFISELKGINVKNKLLD